MKIAAKTIQEFQEIEEKLKKLDEQILKRVVLAQKNIVGIELIIPYDYNMEQVIYIPSFTTQIKNNGDHILIYAGDFFFKIEDENMLKQKITYILV
jgi:hypothetical protein